VVVGAAAVADVEFVCALLDVEPFSCFVHTFATVLLPPLGLTDGPLDAWLGAATGDWHFVGVKWKLASPSEQCTPSRTHYQKTTFYAADRRPKIKINLQLACWLADSCQIFWQSSPLGTP